MGNLNCDEYGDEACQTCKYHRFDVTQEAFVCRYPAKGAKPAGNVALDLDGGIGEKD